MRRALKTALVLASLIAGASPALATKPPTPTPSNDPCSYAVVTDAIACVGYYGGNLLTGGAGSATTPTEQTYINLLLNGPATSSSGSYHPAYSLSTGTVLSSLSGLSGTAGSSFVYDFSPLELSGLTVFAAHFGNTPYSSIDGRQAPEVTAFWLVDLGNTVTSDITIANGGGVSNAQIFATSSHAVPEPATWGMMLLGFGGIGFALRRSRRSGNALMQVA